MPSGSETAAEMMGALRTKDRAERRRAARRLLNFVNGELKDNSSAFVKGFLGRLEGKDGGREGKDLRLSIPFLAAETSEPSDKKAAVLAMICLLDMDAKQRELADSRRLTRFTNILLSPKLLLGAEGEAGEAAAASATSSVAAGREGRREQGVRELAARAVALAAVSFKAYTGEVVERALKIAYEWLAETKPERRLAAVHLLRETATHAPTFFFLKAQVFFEKIFPIIRDQRASIRVEAVAALRAALLVSSQRDATQSDKTHWYTSSYSQAMAALKDASDPSLGSALREAGLHSALLILNEVLRIGNLAAEKERERALDLSEKNPAASAQRSAGMDDEDDLITWLYAPHKPAFFESGTCRRLLLGNYDNLLKALTQGVAPDSKSPLVRPVLLEILPRLVSLKPSSETPHEVLIQGLDYILQCLSTDKEKRPAFLALGLFASKEHLAILRPHIPLIFQILKGALPSSKEGSKKKVAADASAFTCLYLLVGAMGEELEPHLKATLPLLFGTGLSPGLTLALRQVTKLVPGLRTEIQDGLLEQLSQRLMRRGMPPKLSPPEPGPLPQGPVDVGDEAGTVHALRTLATFHFPRHSLQLFLNYVAAGYLSSKSPAVRLASVACCSRLLLPFVMLLERTEAEADGYLPLLHTIHTILKRLLGVGVTDTDGEVRLCVWKSLLEAESWLGGHMGQAEMLELVEMGLQDHQLSVRHSVVHLLGKLGAVNPAYVMPTLRRLLIQILGELGCSGVSRLEEEAARLLASLVAAAPGFVKPYVPCLLNSLIHNLKQEKSREMSLGVVAAIGELATVGGPQLRPSLPTLFPTLIGNLQDPSSLSKRETSLRALGRLVQYTGAVVEPYKDYPQLMDCLLRLLRTEESAGMHRETIRVLGLLGALDPYLEKVYAGSVDSAANAVSLALSMADTSASPKDQRQEIVQWFNWERYSLEEFYPALAIANLMHVLGDPALGQFHTDVVHAVLTIFRKLGGTKSLPFLDQVLPNFIPVIRSSKSHYREFFFTQLGNLVAIVGAHIKPFLPEILALIKEFWTPETPMRQTIIVVVEQVASALGYEFKPFVPQLMPAILRCFHHDDSPGQTVTAKLINALEVCSPTLEEHLHLVIPQIVKLLDSSETAGAVRVAALSLLLTLAAELPLRQYAPRILHALIPIIQNPGNPNDLRAKALKLCKELAVEMGSNFLLFRPRMDLALEAGGIPEGGDHTAYAKTCLQLAQEGSATGGKRNGRRRPRRRDEGRLEPRDKGERSTLLLNDRLLAATWSVDRLSAKEDWTQWLCNLRIQLLKQSPYAALRACGDPLANNYEPLARDLFNAAFMSVWTQLSEPQQDQLSASLRLALEKSNHSEITQTILNLAEFMDHSEKGPLPVPASFLGQVAMDSRAYAKALRYKELEILSLSAGKVAPSHCEALITLNNKLQLTEEAVGVVEYAKQQNISIHLQGRWYEKLHQWEKALESYEVQQAAEPEHEPFQMALAKMRCLEALGDWGKLGALSGELWPQASAAEQGEMAGLAAAGAWGKGHWARMRDYVRPLPANSENGSFLRAVLAVHESDFPAARSSIQHCRDLIDSELTSMVGESYERAYPAMVMVQRLTELEEAIEYKLIPERRACVVETWARRLKGCRDNVEDWQKLLQVHSVVLSSAQMQPSWLKFAALCRRHDKLFMSRKVLAGLLQNSPQPDTLQSKLAVVPLSLSKESPEVVLSWAKQLWMEKERDTAYSLLGGLVERLTPKPHSGSMADQSQVILLSKSYLRLGHWRESKAAEAKALAKDWSFEVEETAIAEALSFYKAARDCNKSSYKAWHSLAAANFSALVHFKEKARLQKAALAALAEQQAAAAKAAAASPVAATSSSEEVVATPSTSGEGKPEEQTQVLPSSSAVPVPAIPTPPLELGTGLGLALSASNGGGLWPSESSAQRKEQVHALAAVRCFFRAMSLCRGSRLQDTLRLLTLWFDYGNLSDINEALCEGTKQVPLETWLQVIPQLIARIDSPRKLVSGLISRVLADIGKAHPQALVYPLTVASKSANKGRSYNALELVQQLQEHSENLVKEAQLVSEELIRVAILWHELWHEGLEEASKLYFTDRNPRAMFATLRPLHALLENGPVTLKEQSFHQTYYRDLKEAKEWCDKFQRSQNAKDMSQAWDLYYVVFKKISKQLPGLTSLQLQYVSPKLLGCRDMELAVPGTYDPSAPLVRIASLHSNLQVITSKQRPRKVCVKGDDGHDYWFLLKGHEDPRQDERVMQLFGLVNTLLLQEPDTSRRNLTIQRYSIVPLSHNSGLIGWVPNCDTLHTLLRDYREKKKTLLNIEHKLMQRMAPDYDKLSLMQKVEVFEHALEHTNGDDLQRILWLKSPSSELWFHRRTNYTRSLAAMSVVGYVLGLGDRHPSNLMLDRMSGKIVHIDFGDCFEVAMTRDKYPEKIPFRLTRMLLKAMEVTGIEGNFKLTCERVLKVLRENRESVLAVLEAFVYDPLLNWRLLDQPAGAGAGKGGVSGAGTGPQGSATTADGPGDAEGPAEQVSQKAVAVMERIQAKLTGRDFPEASEVPQQVSALIAQAVSHENLCQCYIGWCPFW